MTEFNVHRISAAHSHVDSFNAFLEHYSKHVVKRIPPVYISADADYLKHFMNPSEKPHCKLIHTMCYKCHVDVQISVLSLRVECPTRPGSDCLGSDTRMFPRHAKTAHTTYEAPLVVKFGLKVPGVRSILTKEITAGFIPIMVKSKRCNLDGMPLCFHCCNYEQVFPPKRWRSRVRMSTRLADTSWSAVMRGSFVNL